MYIKNKLELALHAGNVLNAIILHAIPGRHIFSRSLHTQKASVSTTTPSLNRRPVRFARPRIAM